MPATISAKVAWSNGRESGVYTGEYLKYGPYKDLAEDPRWRQITPRMCLTHSTGFSNFYFLEPGGKLRIHFDPGTHFSYSGEGMILLQFAIEHGRRSQGLGIDLNDLKQVTFRRLGMIRTSLI